jgi:hypothetical protein
MVMREKYAGQVTWAIKERLRFMACARNCSVLAALINILTTSESTASLTNN